MRKVLRMSDLEVKAKDCYDPADYVLVHKEYLARVLRQAERAGHSAPCVESPAQPVTGATDNSFSNADLGKEPTGGLLP